MNTQNYVYIGRIPGCGCPVAGCMDRGDEHTQEWLDHFDREGYEVERLTKEAAPLLQLCSHKKRGAA